MTRILTVVGARPQFVKAAAVSRTLRMRPDFGITEKILHTGQHFDANMSSIFFEELEIPAPDFSLGISGGPHGKMTGAMLAAIEERLQEEKPDVLLIYGDTNSTLAGTLAAAKLGIPVAHVEAGLRSYNRSMPEEINRVVADQLSELLLCPTEVAVRNLAREGISDGVHNVGDVMYDAAMFFAKRAEASPVLGKLGLDAGRYVLATCHRAENTDDKDRLASILTALCKIAEDNPVVLPLHPRTRKLVGEYGLSAMLSSIRIVDPVPFLDMIALERSAALILTDSGGVQKEAFFYSVPCVTMREETEWVETVELGANTLAGADTRRIVEAARRAMASPMEASGATPYGDGRASEKILELLR